MKIVVSPAKSLNLEDTPPTARATQPRFLKEAETLNKKLERKSKAEVAKLMSISDKLAELNYRRYKAFKTPFNTGNSRPAIYTFDGDVYTGIDAYTIPTEKLDRLQETLRILSGLYGILRPLDLMQAYRLEMGTKLKSGHKNDLYEFWGDKITDSLNRELNEDELFLNLASQEYFHAVKPDKLKVPVVTPVFKDYKNGKLKVISFYAKKARGLMTRFILDKNINTLDGIKGFDYEGYGFSETYSDLDQGELVFVR